MDFLTLAQAQRITEILFIIVAIFTIISVIGVSIILYDRKIKKHAITCHNKLNIKNILTQGTAVIMMFSISFVIGSAIGIIVLAITKVYF